MQDTNDKRNEIPILTLRYNRPHSSERTYVYHGASQDVTTRVLSEEGRKEERKVP